MSRSSAVDNFTLAYFQTASNDVNITTESIVFPKMITDQNGSAINKLSVIKFMGSLWESIFSKKTNGYVIETSNMFDMTYPYSRIRDGSVVMGAHSVTDYSEIAKRVLDIIYGSETIPSSSALIVPSGPGPVIPPISDFPGATPIQTEFSSQFGKTFSMDTAVKAGKIDAKIFKDLILTELDINASMLPQLGYKLDDGDSTDAVIINTSSHGYETSLRELISEINEPQIDTDKIIQAADKYINKGNVSFKFVGGRSTKTGKTRSTIMITISNGRVHAIDTDVVQDMVQDGTIFFEEGDDSQYLNNILSDLESGIDIKIDVNAMDFSGRGAIPSTSAINSIYQIAATAYPIDEDSNNDAISVLQSLDSMGSIGTIKSGITQYASDIKKGVTNKKVSELLERTGGNVPSSDEGLKYASAISQIDNFFSSLFPSVFIEREYAIAERAPTAPSGISVAAGLVGNGPVNAIMNIIRSDALYYLTGLMRRSTWKAGRKFDASPKNIRIINGMWADGVARGIKNVNHDDFIKDLDGYISHLRTFADEKTSDREEEIRTNLMIRTYIIVALWATTIIGKIYKSRWGMFLYTSILSLAFTQHSLYLSPITFLLGELLNRSNAVKEEAVKKSEEAKKVEDEKKAEEERKAEEAKKASDMEEGRATQSMDIEPSVAETSPDEPLIVEPSVAVDEPMVDIAPVSRKKTTSKKKTTSRKKIVSKKKNGSPKQRSKRLSSVVHFG